MSYKRHNDTFYLRKKWSEDLFYFKKPQIIGYWSLDGCRNISQDSSQLRYYIPFKMENVNMNLNEGISKVQKIPNCLDNEKMEHILRWIQNNYKKLLAVDDTRRWLKPHFVCYRGTLSTIVKSIHEYKFGWILCAAEWKGTIYLCPYDTPEDKIRKQNETERSSKMAHWGKKFEQYMLSDDPRHSPDTSKPVNESEQFCCVFQSKLNTHLLLYGGEMDGLCSDEKFEDPLPLNHLKFMELKTGKLSENEGQRMFRKRIKSLNWWIQSYLVGVEDIVCGLRDDEDGIIRHLKHESVSDLEKNSKEFWKSTICMNFCDEFLKFVKRTVRHSCNHTIYKFERIPYGDIVVTKLSPTSEYAFLPDWYTALSKN